MTGFICLKGFDKFLKRLICEITIFSNFFEVCFYAFFAKRNTFIPLIFVKKFVLQRWVSKRNLRLI